MSNVTMATEDNSDMCTVNCRRAYCGDGFLQPGEACDDGNVDGTDECTVHAQLPVVVMELSSEVRSSAMMET